MRSLATGLLLLMTALFIATSIGEPHWHWLVYPKVFAESGMVGACADWFAVVALFRRPMGLPIPHTALIPRNQARIGAELGRFISENFLERSVVTAKLQELDPAAWWAQWLNGAGNAKFVATRAVDFLAPVLDVAEMDKFRAFLSTATIRGLNLVPAAPLAAKALQILQDKGHLLVLFDQGVTLFEQALRQREQLVRTKVSEHSAWWVPRWAEGKIANRLSAGLLETLDEMRQPNHPWRADFIAATAALIQDLQQDPELLAKGERLKAEIIANPILQDYLGAFWREIEARLRVNLQDGDSFLHRTLEEFLLEGSRWLNDDPRLRESFNNWVREAIAGLVVPHGAELGAYIAGVVAKWDSRTLVIKLEEQVGPDLQYIRVNGTLVGGLAGLLIFLMSRLLDLGHLLPVSP